VIYLELKTRALQLDAREETEAAREEEEAAAGGGSGQRREEGVARWLLGCGSDARNRWKG
jgi:hypothetical protein